MKILIFKSNVSNAIYLWNGSKTVCIREGEHRPLGNIMRGFHKTMMESIFKAKYTFFDVDLNSSAQVEKATAVENKTNPQYTVFYRLGVEA